MDMQPIIMFTILTLIIIYLIVQVIKHIGLDKLREVAYQGFLQAEKDFKYGDNHTKFEYVVCIVRRAVPMYLAPFVTEKLLRELIQIWFNLCKDLLNYSAKEK